MRCELAQPNPVGWTMFDWFEVSKVALMWLNVNVLKAYMEELWERTGKWLMTTKQDTDKMPDIDNFDHTFDTIQRLHQSFNGDHSGIAGAVRTVYRRAKRCKFGRAYASGPSIQMINRILRRWLTSNILRDFDFKNCHPSILLDLCTKHGIATPLLRAYVKDPTAFRLEIGSDGKTKVLAAIYMDKDRRCGAWLIAFAAEMDRVEEAFETLFKDDFNDICRHYTRDNLRGAFMARILQQYEAGLLKIVTERVQLWGVAIAAYIFDGFMIRKQLAEGDVGTDASLPEDFLAQLNALVAQAGFNSVKLEEKPVEPINLEQYALQKGMPWIAPPQRDAPRATVLHNRIPDDEIDSRLGLRGVLQVDCAMGGGKSYQMRRLIARARGMGLRVLILTSRQLLGSSWKGELERNLAEYKDDLAFYLDQESLRYADVSGYDVLIIDESRSACSTTVSVTNGDNGSNIATHFEQIKELVKHARWIVGLDADVRVDGATTTMMRQFAAWRGEELQEYRHEGWAMARTVHVQDTKVLIKQMCQQARDGKTFGVCCGSKKMAKQLHVMLVDIVGSDKVRIYTSEDGNPRDLENVDEHWANRIIIFTSKITTGVSFNAKVNEGAVCCVYVFPCAKSASPREMWQMTGRFRELETGVIWLAVQERTADNASQALLRSDVDALYQQQMASLCLSKAKMKLTAYDQVERNFTQSITQWVRFFKYMARTKGYDIFDDFALQPQTVDVQNFDDAKSSLEELEEVKMATVNVGNIPTDMVEKLEKLSRGTLLKQEDLVDFYLFEEHTGVTLTWNHQHAWQKLRIKKTYPDIAPDSITPLAVRILDETFSQRFNLAMAECSTDRQRQYLGLIERTKSSVPNLVPGIGVLLRDMEELALAMGLDSALDFNVTPDTDPDARRLHAAITELRKGNGVPSMAGSNKAFIKNAFHHVFGIDVLFKKPNKVSTTFKRAETLAALRLEVVLRQLFHGAEVTRRDETISTDVAIAALKQLIADCGPTPAELQPEGTKSKRTLVQDTLENAFDRIDDGGFEETKGDE
ncbi:hypothetical protein JKP88DRAFT_289830 [Tribonema minus]|uniref:Replication origin-binding protein n=1 Tax=Tribonema minus TaxID=303371 RepID=A0A835Z3W5_9STRA|nr:hypothetical protein JKP88DRAFT_289830 [Tribonema minus]